jgi:hypothetical protein
MIFKLADSLDDLYTVISIQSRHYENRYLTAATGSELSLFCSF